MAFTPPTAPYVPYSLPSAPYPSASFSDYASKAVADYRTSDTAGTVLGWVKTTESVLTGTIFSVADTATTNESFFVQIDSGGRLNVGTTVGGTTNQVRGGTVVNDGEWHLVVATTDGTTWKLYVDAALETLTVVTGANDGSWWFDLTGADNLVLGALVNTTAQNYFNGTLDELSVFDSALSAVAITEVYETANSLGATHLPTTEITVSALATADFTIAPGFISSGSAQVSVAAAFTLRIAGNVTKATGGPANVVVITDATTYELIDTSTPDAFGDWEHVKPDESFYLTYLSTGCQPICHGPYNT